MKQRPFRFFQSIYFKIPLLFVFILVITFQFIGVIFIDQLETQTVDNFKVQINTQADFLANNITPILSNSDQESQSVLNQLRQTLETFSSTAPARLEVINNAQTIIATNQGLDQSSIGNQTTDADARNVLLYQTELRSEYSDPETDAPIYKLIKPIFGTTQTTLLGVLVIEANMEQIYSQNNNIIDLFLQSSILAVGVALLISFVLSQGLTRPIENMRQQALRISEGVYNYPAEVYGYDELGELTITINELAVKVKDAQESTESERQRLDGILRHMTDGVIGTDQRGRVLLVNDRALQLLNIRQEQAIGHSILRLLNIESKIALKELLQKDTEVMINHSDKGVDSILKGEFSIIRRETGFVTGVVCVLTDVTEQEKTEQEQRDFVSNVSHELRTPLTSIKSYSEALSDGAWRDEKIAPQFLEVIQSESNRMIRMIANLLDLSKMDGGQITLQTDYVDLKRIINHILDRLVFTLESDSNAGNYNFVREFTTRDIYVDIDQDRMTQVIDNILNNAVKYSPDGGTITVKIEDNHRSVIVRITDEGLGISKQDAEKLFDRFYRVDKARSREQGGSGLGLAISKEVIELHGGSIWVDSVEGEGSTFNFELPYTEFTELDGEWG
ncbi:cell wall metabolism sensor histidine kinase WalK [Aerococcaceae bacterium INB8]|uniref:histidine kinase n=1 Tax=Ruoffia halotolerans TaxID=2748684 RepID=A0A839A6V1_9LACT|nr:cell wall metabolism sensor histidine kinase WalK [Ruoffia halotolerans]MBA5729969.1 cell wall metabolism sensor histidine kinase WalK [Ruoffia halotolerans]